MYKGTDLKGLFNASFTPKNYGETSLLFSFPLLSHLFNLFTIFYHPRVPRRGMSFLYQNATGHEPVIIMSQASKGIGYTSWLEPLSCILNLETVWTDSRTTRLYYTWIYAPLWQGIITCSFAERKNMRQWAQTLTIKGFTRYSFTIQFQLLSGRPASRQDRSAQESCSVHIRTCARAYIYSWNIEKYIYFFIFRKSIFFTI